MADNIYKKLASARMELQSAGLKKSGMNNFLRFAYFELSDFLPKINELACKYGFFTQFSISADCAELRVINTEEPQDVANFYVNVLDCQRSQRTFNDAVIDATRKTAEAHEYRDSKDLKPLNLQSIQDLGKNITYLRRYLLMCAFEICEVDALDMALGAPERTQERKRKPESKSTPAPQNVPEKPAETRQRQNNAPAASAPAPAKPQNDKLNPLNRELLKQVWIKAKGSGYSNEEIEKLIGMKSADIADDNVEKVIVKIENQLDMDEADF